MKYEMIGKLGLKIHWMRRTRDYTHNGELCFEVEDKEHPMIKADDLEKVLSEANVVYGWEGSSYWRPIKDAANPTLSARLLCIEKIPREPIKIEKYLVIDRKNTMIIPHEFDGRHVKVTFEDFRG